MRGERGFGMPLSSGDSVFWPVRSLSLFSILPLAVLNPPSVHRLLTPLQSAMRRAPWLQDSLISFNLGLLQRYRNPVLQEPEKNDQRKMKKE